MRHSIQVIRKYFRDFTMEDTQLPIPQHQMFENLADDVVKLLDTEADARQVLYDLITITYTNGFKAGKRHPVSPETTRPVLTGKIVHTSKDY